MTMLNQFVDCWTQEDFAFTVVDLMRPYIEDLDSIEYEFHLVDAKDQVEGEISGLRQRSLEAIASVFERTSRGGQGEWSSRVATPILFPFLLDQLEIRLTLLRIYCQRMRFQNINATNLDLGGLVAKIGLLTSMIQECPDGSIEEEGPTTQSNTLEKCLTVA